MGVAAAIAGVVAGGVTKVMGDTPTGKIVATVVPALVMVIALFMILDQLRIAEQTVTIAFAAIMFALALGLAFASGSAAATSRRGCSRTPSASGARDQARQDVQTGTERAQQHVPGQSHGSHDASTTAHSSAGSAPGAGEYGSTTGSASTTAMGRYSDPAGTQPFPPPER